MHNLSHHNLSPGEAPALARLGLPDLGLGLGLRNVHFDHILREWPELDWFEAITENYIDSGGRPRYVLDQIAERYPIVLHGVSLSIGSNDPLNRDYLAKLKKLADHIRAPWISDHLCWTGILGINTHDLLPLPLTDESLAHVIKRINQVQDILQRPLILENPSAYLTFKRSTIEETSFFRCLAEETGCGFLLDVNNVYVSCFNAGADPFKYIQNFPCEHVVQMHLAGHQDCGTHIIDTHDGRVRQEVWNLFALAWDRTGGVSTLLEWDSNIPSFDQCRDELMRANAHMIAMQTAQADNQTISQNGSSNALSTPVDFMVPAVMDDTIIMEN